MSKYLNRRAIVEKAHGYQVEDVPAPEWGGVLLVRELTMTELLTVARSAIDSGADVTIDDLANITFDPMAISDLFPMIASWVIVDEEMKSILTPEDIEGMTARGMPVLERVIETAFNLTDIEQAQEGLTDPNG